MRQPFAPPGWRAGTVERRFASSAPSSYDGKSRTVNCIISVGSPVRRVFGIEKLRVAPDAVDLSRLQSSGIPLLDSHNQHGIENSLGRFTRTWFKRGELWGQITFNDTAKGRLAEGMVKRGEIAGISAGYTVSEWQISDAKGNVIDPETTRISLDDDLTFEATRWELLEGSLVTVPADQASMIRSHSLGGRTLGAVEATKTRLRMKLRAARMPIPLSLK
jgi:phage head maturation protease